MKSKDVVYIDGGCAFDNGRLKKIVVLLEYGYVVEIGISCRGTSKRLLEYERYKDFLLKYYKNSKQKLCYDIYYGSWYFWLDYENFDNLV